MRKILVSTLALMFAVAPAMAQELEKSVEVSLFDQFQMVGDLGTVVKSDIPAATGLIQGKTTAPDVYFQNRRMRFGASASYGILSVDFVVEADKDLGGAGIGIDTAEATLDFFNDEDEDNYGAFKLSMGRVGTRHKGASSSATMGTQDFLAGSGLSNNMGIKLHGSVANNLFEYALSVFHGYQPKLLGKAGSGTVAGVYGPGVGLQVRFNLLKGKDNPETPKVDESKKRVSTGNSEYFLAEKSALTFGFTFDYQRLGSNHKFGTKLAKSGGSVAQLDSQNLMHFDVFLTGDIAFGDNSLPFLLIYEHVGFNPLAAKKLKSASIDPKSGGWGSNDITTAAGVTDSIPIGKLTYGIGFYVGSLKIMPAFKHSINIFKTNKDVVKGGLAHQLEASLGYFPYGHNLNLKIGYVYTGGFSKLKMGANEYKVSYDDHKLITQVQMKI